MTLVDVNNPKYYFTPSEPRKILLNKENYLPLKASKTFKKINSISCSLKAFNDISNEFRWLTLYVSKGLLRHQILYAKSIFDQILIPQYLQLLKWHFEEVNKAHIDFGNYDKELTKYLDEKENVSLISIFPNGEELDVWDKLFHIYDAFHKLSRELACFKGYPVMEEEIISIKQYLTNQYINFKIDKY